VVLPALMHLFNFIFTCSEFPSRWKCAVVLPIPKVSNPVGFSDFRPISLLPCLSKVCEVLMAGQMNGGTFVVLGYSVHFSWDLNDITVLQRQS
jgi:hypothetical protein